MNVFTTRTFRVLLLLFVAGGALWLGGSVARMIVGFDVFTPGTLEFRSSQTEDIRIHTIWLFTILGGVAGWCFLACAVGGVGLIATGRRMFRTHGWMMISAILFVLIIPVQAYIAWEDYQLWTLFDRNTGMPLASTADIVAKFMARYTNTAVNMLLGLSLLSALTIIVFTSLRPLQQQKSNVSE